MSQWKMTADYFKYLLEEVQDYKCALTGLPLLPENVWIMPKVPRERGGKLGPDNVYLVHECIAKLARDFTRDEILATSRAVVDYLGKPS